MRRLLAVLLCSGVLVAPAASSAPTCKHLIVDPRGDVDPLGSPPLVDDQRLVDVLAVDLKTDRKVVTAAFWVDDVNPETASALRHNFSVYFGSGGQRYALEASRQVDGDFFTAWVVVAGQDYSDGEAAYAWSMRGLGDVSGRFDGTKNVITVTAPLSLFADTGGLKKALSDVHALSWTGAGAAGTAAEGSDDMTDRVPGYVMGRPACMP